MPVFGVGSSSRSVIPGQEMLANLEDYWRRLRQSEKLPARIDIAPDEIDAALPYCFILQHVATGTARFRVAGQQVCDLIKMDARGMPISALFAPAAHNDLRKMIEMTVQGPAIVGIPLVSEAKGQAASADGQMLLLPLRDQQGQATRILGAVVARPEFGRRPRRFLIARDQPLRHEPLGLRLAAQQLLPKAPALTKRPDASRPALRLVVNNG